MQKEYKLQSIYVTHKHHLRIWNEHPKFLFVNSSIERNLENFESESHELLQNTITIQIKDLVFLKYLISYRKMISHNYLTLINQQNSQGNSEPPN